MGQGRGSRGDCVSGSVGVGRLGGMNWARSRVVSGVLAVCLLGMGAFAGARPAGAAFGEPAWARGGMVVSAQVDATRAGVAMLEAGGNAIDAAVATAFALSVTTPYSSGIGGGAFILMRLASGETLAIDCRETAPAAATRDMYLAPGLPERASRSGPLAVATPGLVAGLALVQERHGTLPLAQVMAPAIALAAEGFEIGPHHARMLGYMARYGMPERFPETGRIQFPPGGEPAQPGWRLVQSDLAESLRAIAEHGPEVFYTGSLGQAIADHLAELGGLVTREDLAGYRVAEREPLRGEYRGYTIESFPPPSSGGVALIEILNIIEGYDLAALGLGSSASLHRIGEAMKLAFADRAAYLGDTDFVDVPVAKLISKPYAETLRAKINPPRWRRAPWTWGRSEAVISVPGPGLPQEDSGTTHLSTSDAAGNAVAITKTINTPFGSGITVPGTGIVLNNEMDDFAVAPYSPNAYGLIDTRGANAIAPLKRPLSSMTPTLVSRDGKVFMVTGSPGGPRIISTTLLSIVNVIDYSMNVRGAVSQQRFHHQWVPDTLRLEPAFAADVVDALVERGHEVEVSSRNWSAAEAIVIDPDTGIHYGGSDPRRDGLALGPAPPTPR
ncbi:gamma-glutamyltransferase [Myxococcota bacterium]|nr:gamma-glutamyltransferase [Myxococcota bacterium]